jgi:hypothetical protein
MIVEGQSILLETSTSSHDFAKQNRFPPKVKGREFVASRLSFGYLLRFTVRDKRRAQSS